MAPCKSAKFLRSLRVYLVYHLAFCDFCGLTEAYLEVKNYASGHTGKGSIKVCFA
ncbi:MAG: hypothetical protein AB1393_00825 [Candidatus Edwardsbacteria bacterium]